MEIAASVYIMIDIDMFLLISTVLGSVASICTIRAYLESKQKK